MSDNYKKTYDYLLEKYKRVWIGKKEMAVESGASEAKIDLAVQKKMGIPPFRKDGNKKNSRVVFHIADVAQFLTEDFVQTM